MELFVVVFSITIAIQYYVSFMHTIEWLETLFSSWLSREKDIHTIINICVFYKISYSVWFHFNVLKLCIWTFNIPWRATNLNGSAGPVLYFHCYLGGEMYAYCNSENECSTAPGKLMAPVSCTRTQKMCLWWKAWHWYYPHHEVMVNRSTRIHHNPVTRIIHRPLGLPTNGDE